MGKNNSCVNSLAIICYMKERCPARLEELFSDMGPEMLGVKDPEAFLSDPSNWISSKLLIKLYDNAKNILNDENAAYKIGFSTIPRRRLGYIQNFLLLAFGSPARVLKHIQRVNDHFNKTKKVHLLQCSSWGAKVRLSWTEGIPLSYDFCLMNKGIYQAVPLAFGLPPAYLKETKCYFKGDPYCEYEIQWQPKNKIKTILDRFSFRMKASSAGIRELERDKERLKLKYDQVHQLNIELQGKIDQLLSLQQTSSAILSTLKRDELLDLILKSLLGMAHLDRAGIFLVDTKKESLRFIHAVGITSNELDCLKGYHIPLGKEDNIIARSVGHDGPMFIEDVEKTLLNHDNPLLKTLNPKAFILVPLRAKGQIVGVLVGDRENDRDFIRKIDKEFLRNFANHIALAMENSNLYLQLEESEQKYREIVEHAQEGIWIVDTEGIITFSNKRLAAMLGYENAIGKNVYALVAPSSKKTFLGIFKRNMEGEVVREELHVTTSSGRLLTVLLSSVPMMVEGRYTGSLAMITNLTDHKRMEERVHQMQKLESVGTLAGGIAHDFNNILTTILSHTQLMMRTMTDQSNVMETLGTIEKSCVRAAELVRNLLTFSRGEDNKKTSACNIAPIIADTLRLLRKSLPPTIHIVNELQQDLPPVVCNPTQVHQVILNLVMNARDAMPEGGTLSVSLEMMDPGLCPYPDFQGDDENVTGGLRLVVKDTGQGIPPDIINRVFDPFFTTKEHGKGTGLGLAIVYGIMKNMGGAVHVESDPGKGTVFSLYFPIRKPGLTASPDESEPLPVITGKILVIEEEDIMRDLAGDILTAAGYTVILASGDEEGLGYLASGRTESDVALIMMHLPVDPSRLAATMKKIAAIAPNAIMLFCRGEKSGLPIELLARQYGGIFTKPFSANVLCAKVRELLSMMEPS